MSLLDDILGLFHGPVPATVDTHVALQAQATAVAQPGELELTQSVVQQIIEPDEGDVLTAYPDPGSGGDPWTIGYGHTGPEVHQGLVWTQAQAEAALEEDLDKFKVGVIEALGAPEKRSTNDNQFSAMVSLAYNVGLGNFKSSSMLRFHLAWQFQQAADAFLLWDKSCGNVMAGLVRRRHQERELYLGLAVTESGT